MLKYIRAVARRIMKFSPSDHSHSELVLFEQQISDLSRRIELLDVRHIVESLEQRLVYLNSQLDLLKSKTEISAEQWHSLQAERRSHAHRDKTAEAEFRHHFPLCTVAPQPRRCPHARL